MSDPSFQLGLYVRLSSPHTNWSLPTAEIPAWEICRQEIQPLSGGGISLVENVLATGMTLRAAWAAMIALTNAS